MRKIAVISDFDGTMAERDVGHHFFERFIPDGDAWRALLERWKLGLLSSRECLEQELAWATAGKSDLDAFVAGESLDPYVKDFVDFCWRRGYEILIASDGFDYYIDRLLIRAGLGHIPYRANRLVLKGERLAAVEFPYYNLLECAMCGNCKRHHVEELKKKGFFVAYIGNGYSDRCPAAYADIVLAKGDLLDHCRRERIDHVPFENFRDVERELTTRLILSL